MEFKKFKDHVKRFMDTEAKRRDKVQDLILIGLEKYHTDGDTSYLNYLIQSAVGVRSMPTKTIVGYIKDHANVRYEKLKDGKPGFKKSAKGSPAEVIEPQVPWYDWAGAKHQAQPYDAEAAVIRLRSTIEKNLKGGTIKDEQKAREMLEYLERIA